MGINIGTMAPADTIAERKQQLRTLFEASGVLRFDRAVTDNADIYWLNTNPTVCKARVEFDLRGYNTYSSAYHSNANQTPTTNNEYRSRSYIYSAAFDDSGLGVPALNDVRRFTTSFSAYEPPATFVGFDQPFNYIYINQPHTKSFTLNGGDSGANLSFMVVKSQSGREIFINRRTGEQLSSYFFQGDLQNPGGQNSSMSLRYPRVDESQWTPVSVPNTAVGQSQSIAMTIDGVNTHDRMIQNFMAFDPPSSVASTPVVRVTTDPCPELFTFTRQGSLLLQDTIYRDDTTGVEYFSPNAAGTALIKLLP